MFSRHLGKQVMLKAYPCTVRRVKCSCGSGLFLFRVFCLEKISMNAIFKTCSLCQNYMYVDAAIKSKMPDGLN